MDVEDPAVGPEQLDPPGEPGQRVGQPAEDHPVRTTPGEREGPVVAEERRHAVRHPVGPGVDHEVVVGEGVDLARHDPPRSADDGRREGEVADAGEEVDHRLPGPGQAADPLPLGPVAPGEEQLRRVETVADPVLDDLGLGRSAGDRLEVRKAHLAPDRAVPGEDGLDPELLPVELAEQVAVRPQRGREAKDQDAPDPLVPRREKGGRTRTDAFGEPGAHAGPGRRPPFGGPAGTRPGGGSGGDGHAAGLGVAVSRIMSRNCLRCAVRIGLSVNPHASSPGAAMSAWAPSARTSVASRLLRGM